MEITSKDQMYALQRQHLLGNSLDMWDSLYQVPEHIKDVYFRGRKVGMELVERIPLARAEVALYEYCIRNHCYSRDVSIGEAAPNCRRIFQGEVFVRGHSTTLAKTEVGLVLHYTYADCNMREAMRRGLMHTHGMAASSLLKYVMSVDEYEELSRLLNEWPGHVVEFTLFSERCGWAHERLIFWEVRGTY